MRTINDSHKALETKHLDFVATGLACHAICLLEQSGILQTLVDSDEFLDSSLRKFSNPHLIRAVLVTLVGAGVLSLANGTYCLTLLGQELAKNIGTIMLPFVGYGRLLANQFQLLDNPNEWEDSEIDYATIAVSSISFGQYELDPTLIRIFKMLNPVGTVCDLGCGTGEKLNKICSSLNLKGLGIEKSTAVINESRKLLRNNSQIEIIQGDITKLDGIWEDVEIAMISFVLHDIHSPDQANIFLSSLKNHFPRLRCLIVVDIVSLSENHPSIMPGFDYAHGLQGITPRGYEETREVFAGAKYEISSEIPVNNMPNTYVWLLQPANIK